MTVLASPSGIVARAQERATDIIKHAEYQAGLMINLARLEAEQQRGMIREKYRQELRAEMDAETIRQELAAQRGRKYMARRRKMRHIPHDVYRIYDSAGNLLYVGCSWNAFSRVPQHKREHQPWFPMAATVDVDTFADFTAARLVEAQAIADEAPAWNRAKESRAIIRGRGIEPVTVEAFRGIPIQEFWKEG